MRIPYRLFVLPGLIAAAVAALAPPLAAQEDGHVVEVRSLVSRDAVRPGETFKAAVILKIRAGFHINDNAPLDEFMIPTALGIEDGQGFEAVEFFYPAARRARFSYADNELAVYDGEVVLGVLLKAGDGLAPGDRALKAVLSYQACDNESCLAPRELPFAIAVPVSAESGGREVHHDIFDKIRFKSLQK
jgi:hypothetical protein